MTVAEIRAKYPNPSIVPRSPSATDDFYCVMGAALRMLGKHEYSMFPSANEAAKATGWSALGCYEVIRANDTGLFELAWRRLGDLLEGNR